jgi:hypothetical protein
LRQRREGAGVLCARAKAAPRGLPVTDLLPGDPDGACIMTDFEKLMADYEIRRRAREVRIDIEIQHYKQAVIPLLAAAGITYVEVRFDGCGDSGAVEEITCLDAEGNDRTCPDEEVVLLPGDTNPGRIEGEEFRVADALEALTYLALERHHAGWENNDGACGDLVIEVAKDSFVLECHVRYTSTHDHFDAI